MEQGAMEQVETNTSRKPIGRIIGIGVLVAAAITLALVIFETDRYPPAPTTPACGRTSSRLPQR